MDYLKNLMGDKFKEDLTLDDVSNFLEAQSTKTDETLKHYKDLISKANGEAAKYKKQMRANLSEQEQKEQEQKDELEALKARCNELETAKKLADQTAKYLDLGYDKELAESSAQALINGDIDLLLNNQKTYIESVKKSAVEKAMDDTIRPSGSYVQKPVDYSAKIAEAQAKGRMSEAAYYMRLEQQQKG